MDSRSEPDVDVFDSRRSTVRAPRGVVATSQPLAAQAGLRALREGGNAFDAAVAAAATLAVVEPMSTGLGGDAFALYRTADGDVGGLQSCGGAPAAATPTAVRDAVADREGVDPADVEMPERGALAVTVPGAVRGWEATVERFGRRSLADALRPAIRYATDGFPVTEVIASAWAETADVLTDPGPYTVDGRAPRTGERIAPAALGDTLRTIADEGADAVYEGRIADEIAGEVQKRGGLLAADDLAGFEPRFVDPVSTTYRGAEVFELPPTNQGLIALEALNVAAEVGAGDCPYDSTDRVHYFAEATKRAFRDGHRYVADPDYESVPPLASAEYAAKRAAGIGPTASAVTPRASDPAEDADTVLIAVADTEGNVVSYINSLFHGFGSGVVAGDTGIVLQNRGASFALDPDHPNVIAPGKRPFHTLIPGVVRFDRDDWAAFGVMGGYMQPQGHVQVLSNLLDYDLSLQAALDRPRWRFREDGTLAVEERLGGTVPTKLARRGHDVRVLPPSAFGGGQIARNREGRLSGATEPRKDGTVAGY